MSDAAWSDAENEAIVLDYLDMLADDLAGRSYFKASHNRALQEAIGRGRGSIEYKHHNISAVLMELGETWITGYKPAFNYQASLVDAVVRHLDRVQAIGVGTSRTADAAAETPFAPAPALQNEPPPDETGQMAAVARRFDVASIQARNVALGRAGEARVVRHEQAKLVRLGRDELAAKVRWVSEMDGDGAGYDIASFEETGAPRLIEVKTTNGWERTPFYISRNELEVAEARQDAWTLVRVWNFVRSPRAFELRPPLTAHVSLMPTSYRAEFAARR